MRAPEFWNTKNAPSTLLLPLSWIFWGLGRLRALIARCLNPHQPSVRLICVGNLVAGGAGKTPTVIALVKEIQEENIDVHILCSGYGGKLTRGGFVRVNPTSHSAADVGDEALLLAHHAPTWAGKNRKAAAKAAVAAGAQILIMDDGYQYPHLVPHLLLLVIDAGYGFGNGRMLPAGPLREPLNRGLDRADGYVLIRSQGEDCWQPSSLQLSQKPVVHAQIVADAKAAQHLKGKPVVAFAGIGRPEKFFDTLEQTGATILKRHSFSDHHPFTTAQFKALLAEAEENQALLVTTHKDAVRLPDFLQNEVFILPVSLVPEQPFMHMVKSL